MRMLDMNIERFFVYCSAGGLNSAIGSSVGGHPKRKKQSQILGGILRGIQASFGAGIHKPHISPSSSGFGFGHSQGHRSGTQQGFPAFPGIFNRAHQGPAQFLPAEGVQLQQRPAVGAPTQLPSGVLRRPLGVLRPAQAGQGGNTFLGSKILGRLVSPGGAARGGNNFRAHKNGG
jgi:hypothetical protein